MRHTRRNLQRIVRLAAVGGLVCGSLMVTDAMAGEPAQPGTLSGGGAPAVDPAVKLMSQLGTSRTAGTWMGSDGHRVVAVTDAEAATQVQAAGARAKVVRHSMDRLRDATEALRRAPRVSGTAWAVDYASNQVVVHADRTVSSSDWSRMSAFAGRLGGFVHMERTKGAFTTRVNGGAAMFGGGSRCSAGFNVTDGRDAFVLTAGHCGVVGTAWFGDRRADELLGTTVSSSFPGNDYSLIKYQNGEQPAAPGIVEIGGGRGVKITGVADPVVGQQVFRSGSTTGFRDGRVTALNATVNYPEGTVSGLIETTVCAEPGDSGGPLIAQGLALGVTSGGNGDCASGGVTFFQPATKAMADLGVTLPGQAPAGAGTGTAQQPGSQTDPSGANAGPGGAGGAAPPSAGGAIGPGIVTGIADGLGPLGAVGPGVGVVGASLLLLIASRWIQTAQGRKNYRDYYSQTWA
ncbi:S1 family peptidase [Streptomyces sp. NPDC059176]|uniref:S1 family peptidase n=1 Tax=unclassified Streptomyces TaxID=2593676 RepID=UPI0036B2C4CC